MNMLGLNMRANDWPGWFARTQSQSVPALPPGFAYLKNPDGSYAVSSNGAYVVRYTG